MSFYCELVIIIISKNHDYWDYSMNELAFQDCRSFIEKIAAIKQKELGDSNFEIIAVAHSVCFCDANFFKNV